MLTNYIRTAMHKATYELLEDGTFYGEIPECQGVWANATTLEACREDLQDSLEGWILLGLRLGHTLPILDGVDLNITKEVAGFRLRSTLVFSGIEH
ncbi:Type II toxin-antitoxin system HicB family antitoxin [Nostoc sp. DSM 114161]|jgi:predicted RNase H-like HicB family nuclease|uniref:type II toxin-antitoxin system HicB family antitoxin n=1 Tax=Nostoc sp. DSM 114161 TaxID=3440143 RepID=UPI004045A1B7